MVIETTGALTQPGNTKTKKITIDIEEIAKKLVASNSVNTKVLAPMQSQL